MRSRNASLLQSAGLAFLIGSVLALYISLTTFWQMPYGAWLALHNILVVLSLVLAGLIGYRKRGIGSSFRSMLLTIFVFFLVVLFLYIGSYTVTTGFFADQMVWIPFFYRDYNYHGFASVAAYLDHGNNFRELLELQVFSLSISSVLYFAAGSLGYGIRAALDRLKKALDPTQSTV